MTLFYRSLTVLFVAGLPLASVSYAESNYSTNAQLMSAQHDTKQRSYGQKTGDKALNGLANMGLGFWELPKNVINTTNDSNIFYGLTGGLFKGILNTVGRLSVGAVDLVTAPIPTKPVTYPIHAWEDTKVDTTYGNVFDLDLASKPIPVAVEPVTQTRPAVAPRLPAVNQSAPNPGQTNRAIDAYFKKQMMK